MLVVAADESVMPQTREHFEICRLLGVAHGVVAVTKSDLADADTVELVKMESARPRGRVVPRRRPDRAGLVEDRRGPGRLESRRSSDLARRVRPSAPTPGAVRLPIDRVFSVKGFGTVVTGTLLSGSRAGRRRAGALPGERRVKVRGVQVHGETAAVARAGQRAALNLGGIDLAEIGRGDTLLTPATLEPTRMIDARIEVVSSASARCATGRASGSTRAPARSWGAWRSPPLLPGRPGAGERGVGRRRRPSRLPGGRSAYVRLRFEAAGRADARRPVHPARLLAAVTVAGGLVLDPHPARGAIRTPSSLDALRPSRRERSSPRPRRSTGP